jgi:hypothetical protein
MRLVHRTAMPYRIPWWALLLAIAGLLVVVAVDRCALPADAAVSPTDARGQR